MMEDSLTIYTIFDTRKEKYWVTRDGVATWTLPGYARSAWNNQKPIVDYPELIIEKKKYHTKVKNFKLQDIFVIHSYTYTKTNMEIIK